MKKDKRKLKRYPCFVPVESRKGTEFDRSQTVDISSKGAGFLSRRFIPVDTKMAVELNLSSQGDPVMAMGRVTWIRQIPDSDMYHLGLTFTEIPARIKNRLEKIFV